MARKIFVGSLPSAVTEDLLRSEFDRFGRIDEVFIKEGCPVGKQWAFVTFASADAAAAAKEACDRLLRLPGAERACDVMLAKNQGSTGAADAGSSAPRKIFVGSLPDGIQEEALRLEFSKYGIVEDLFLKPGCEPGRQWAFVTFDSPNAAAHAQEASNGRLHFEGAARPCEVTLARNQGMFGSGALQQAAPAAKMPIETGPKKVFVGTLPDSVDENILTEEFSNYGVVTDVFLKPGCESGRKWGFITFSTSEEAKHAKASCDRVLMLPGAERPCEVTMAKHQGMYGQDSLDRGGGMHIGGGNYNSGFGSSYNAHGSTPYGGSFGGPSGGSSLGNHRSFSIGGGYSGGGSHSSTPFKRATAPITAAPIGGAGSGFAPSGGGGPAAGGPCKVFVGSLPDGISDRTLRREFGRYGEVTDVFIKPGCEPGRQWAFVTFASASEAQQAKEATDRQLTLPGADRACEVMMAKHQGLFGQAPLSSFGQNMNSPSPAQPPPPRSPPPPHMTPWRTYKTQSGLPYYHNTQTGQTVWECPTEFVPPPGNAHAAGDRGGQGSRYSPY